MNEYERRALELAINHVALKRIVESMGSAAVVEHFGYVLEIGSIAAPLVAGVQRQGVITLRADAWFVLTYISGAVILPNGSTWGNLSTFTDPGNVKLQITDTGAGQELFSTSAPAGIITGTPNPGIAGVPLTLPTPRAIPPNTNIKVEVTQIGNTALENPAPVGFFLVLNGARVAMV